MSYIFNVTETYPQEEESIYTEPNHIYKGSEINLQDLQEQMESDGVTQYWLMDSPKANPNNNYIIWVERDYGSSTHRWGLRRLEA